MQAGCAPVEKGTEENISWTTCRIPLRPFDYMVKAGNGPPKTEIKDRYRRRRKSCHSIWLLTHLPDDFDPSTVTEAMIEEIHALNREMIAAGVRIFACGISPASNAKTLRAQPDGKVLVTDGPYTETKEHMGGFWILEAADMDEALAWGRKAAIACRAPARCARSFKNRRRPPGPPKVKRIK